MGSMTRGIWIGNLRYNVDKEALENFFGNISTDIEEINLPQVKEEDGKVRNKGFAFITFKSDQATKQAVSLSETSLNGRRVLIKFGNDYTKRKEKKIAESDPTSSIFLGNLEFDVVKQDVIELSSEFQRIVGIRIGTFEDTGKCKGFAYIDFEDVQSAKAAFSILYGKKLKGRKLRVEFATDKAVKRGKPWLDNPQKPKKQSIQLAHDSSDVKNVSNDEKE